MMSTTSSINFDANGALILARGEVPTCRGLEPILRLRNLQQQQQHQRRSRLERYIHR
jgi:hypothetical protein